MHQSCSLLISGIHFYSHWLRKESARMSQVLFVDRVVRLTFHRPKPHFFAISAQQLYIYQKNMSQWTLCENKKAFLSELPEIWPKECRDSYELLLPLKSRTPLIWIFSFLTFLHQGIEDVERHLLWKFHKRMQRKSWSNGPQKLLACIRFLYKVVHKNGRTRAVSENSIALARLNLNFFSAWTIFMKLGTPVYDFHGYCLRFFNLWLHVGT